MWWGLTMGLAGAATPPEGRLVPPRTDVGLGLNVGLFLPGFKARVVHVTRSGLMAGVDADVGSIVFFTSLSASAVLGYDARLGKRQRLRAYGRVGGGSLTVLSENGFTAPAYNLSAGSEWRAGRAFGLGLEGGGHFTNQDVVPYAQFTFMFYVR